MRDKFLANYRHDLPLTWFDDHVKARFGIDVYAHPFPPSGFRIYGVGAVRLLVVRTELPDDVKAQTIAEFTGLDGLRLRAENVGSTKEYSETYQLFRNQVKLPVEYVDRMCQSRFFRHFYPPDFIEEVRARWISVQGHDAGDLLADG